MVSGPVAVGRIPAERHFMDDRKPSWSDPHLEEDMAPASREAIAWFNRLHGGEVSEHDRTAFQDWLDRDPAHPPAFQQIEQLWKGLSALPGAPQPGLSRRHLGKAALALAIAGGAWSAYRLRPFADYRTGTGERRAITLPDGSRAELSTSTALSVDVDGADRLVTLHYGEVFFDVAEAGRRPFVVNASRGRITALGTAFAIADDDDRLVVTVTHHAVRIEAGGRRLRVEAGLQTVLDGHGIGTPAPVDAADVLAWREGRLIFINAPLERVIGVLNRWRRDRLILMNRSMAAQPVTLIVNLEDVKTALVQLQDALHLETTHVTPLLTFVYRR